MSQPLPPFPLTWRNGCSLSQSWLLINTAMLSLPSDPHYKGPDIVLIFSCLDHLVHTENAITLPFNTEKSLCPFNRLILILNLYPAQFSFRKTLGKVSLQKKSFLISQVSIVLKNSFGTKSFIRIFFSTRSQRFCRRSCCRRWPWSKWRWSFCYLTP